jgi:hypothetical protein
LNLLGRSEPAAKIDSKWKSCSETLEEEEIKCRLFYEASLVFIAYLSRYVLTTY